MASDAVLEASSVAGQSSGSNFVSKSENRHVDANKALRALIREKCIDATASLVQVYNEATTEETENHIHRFLCLYRGKKEVCMHPNAVLEYAELCKLEPRTDRDKELLREVVSDLVSRIPAGKFAGTDDAEALHRALLWAPPELFQRDCAKLVALVDKLTESLSPLPRLTKTNFPFYEPTLFALHHVLALMQRIARGKVSFTEKKRFRQTLRQKRELMKDSCKYYPVQYHFRHIEQSIQRLELDETSSSGWETMQCLFGATCGLLYIFHGVRRLVALDIDPSTFAQGFNTMKELAADRDAAERQWYDLLQTLEYAARDAAKDLQKLDIFEKCHTIVTETLANMRKNEESKALLFGLMVELRHLILEGTPTEARASAASKLFALSESIVSSTWKKDKDIMEALLNCLHAAHSKGEHIEEAYRALQLVTSVNDPAVSSTMRDWMDNRTLDEKLAEELYMPSDPTGDLFWTMGREIGLLSEKELRGNIEDLKRTFRSNAFATVASLFDRDDYTHVCSMKHRLVFYQFVEEQNDEISGSADSIDGADGRLQEKKIQQPIAIESLFSPRSLRKGAAAREIRKILLHGKPGSGKTCISKAIPCMWAMGQIGQEFEAVYVLPVRELNGHSDQESNALERTIVRHCFPRRHETEYEGLCVQVDNHLDIETTLLVIDGVDEANDAANRILETVKQRSCRILWLTRPYNLRHMRKLVDLEVKCLGFDDALMEEYMKRELSSDDGQKLIESVRVNSSLWEVAHIPVMAQIICFLWKEGGLSVAEDRRNNPFAMYTEMVNFVWLRFSKKTEMETAMREDVFLALESIAFEAICEDQILISQGFVGRYATSWSVKEVLRHSGFLLFKVEGLDYQFPHLTFQEYFAARWLARSLQTQQSKEQRNATEFLRRQKYLERHKRTISFLAQQLAEDQGVDGLPELLSKLDEGPVEMIGLQHLYLKLFIVESWLTALDASSIDEFCRCGAVVHLVDISISIVGDRAKPFGIVAWIFPTMIQVCPKLFSTVPRLLDFLVKKAMIDKALRGGIFGEVVEISKGSADHMKVLVEATRDRINSKRLWKRGGGAYMLGELLQRAPYILEDFLPLAEKMFFDYEPDAQGTALQVFHRLVLAAPSLSSKFLSMIERASTSLNVLVRQRTMEATSNFAAEVPEVCTSLLPLIERGCTDEDEDVRRAASRAMRHVVSAAPFLVADFAPVLERLCSEADASIRLEAMKTFECIAALASQFWDSLLIVFKKLCSDDDSQVRQEATDVAGRLALDAPHLLPDLFPAIKRACSDACAAVRAVGMKAIKRLATRSSKITAEMLHIAEKGYLDENNDVRQAAMEAVGRLASAPHLSKDVMPILRKGCSDEDVLVRLWSVDALGRLACVAPHLSRDILTLLKGMCADENDDVRLWTMDAVGQLASRSPHLSEEVLPLIEKGRSDQNGHVRLWAIKAVSRLAMAAPHLSESLFPMLKYADVDTHLYNRATEAMKLFLSVAPHFAARIEMRVESEHQNDAPMETNQPFLLGMELEDLLRAAIENDTRSRRRAAFGLLQNAVTLEETKRSGYVRVVVHSTAARVVGEYTREEASSFRVVAEQHIASSHDDLLDKLRHVATK